MKLKVISGGLLAALILSACGREDFQEDSQILKNQSLSQEETLVGSVNLACSIARPGDCLPKIPNPLEEIKKAVEDKADQLAQTARSQNKDTADCEIIVAAGLAAWGAQLSGPYGAFVGGAAGLATARLACRKAFGE